MPTFVCQSIGQDGLLVEGRIVAGTRVSALEQLRARGHLPVSIAETSEEQASGRFFKFERGRLNDKQLLAMNSQLSLLLGAGQQLEQALSLIAKSTPSKKVRRILADITDQLHGGASFAEALELTNQFPALYIAMVRAGEASGSLEQAIERMTQLLTRSVQMRDTVVSALLYPAVLVSVAAISIALLLNFVVPQFATLFQGSESTLPWITQLVLLASTWVQDYGVFGLLATLLLILLLPKIMGWLRLEAYWDSLILRIPILGPLIAVQQTARFTRTLGSLEHSGVPLPVALALSSKVVRNRSMIAVIERMRTGVREGRTLGSSLTPDGPIPDLAAHLIRVGEDSGRLEEVLLQVSDIYEAKFELAVKRLLAVLEPACVIVLGIFIGGIIVAILLAVISVNQLAI
jgi:general secretion pathway protein F